MATFIDWWTKGRHAEPRPYTFVCGSEPVLVDTVVQGHIRALKPTDSNLLGLRAGVNREQDIWAILGHLPIDPTSPKLVVIRDAEKLEHWEKLHPLLVSRRSALQNHALFVSNDKRIPVMVNDDGEKFAPGYIGDLRRTKQAIIQVNSFTQETAPIAVQWVQSMVEINKNVAAHLLNRAAGDLRLARDVALKLAALQTEVSITLVNQLLQQQPADNLVDSLVKVEKHDALAALDHLDFKEIPRVLGSLDAQLTFMQELNRMQVNQMSYGDMMRAMRSRAFLIKEFLPAARHYDEKAVARRRAMLATADTSMRGGWPDAILETVVLNW